MDERHSYRLVRDLLDHKDTIFGELKRQSGAGNPNSRPRAISTDESNRRANMEARARAIADRSRANSPAPSGRHRRDRSAGGSGSVRFPINVGSPKTRTGRQSLEVPGAIDTAVPADASAAPNGSAENVVTSPEAIEEVLTPVADSQPESPPGVEKSGSLSRSGGRHSRIAGLNRESMSTSSEGGDNEEKQDEALKPVGVTLEDKPMDD